MNPRCVGMIGLGLLGSALVERILASGITAVGFDVDAARCDEFTALGGRRVESARNVASNCARLIFSLPDHHVVESVFTEIGSELRAGLHIIDTTTGDPDFSAALGADLFRKGVHYLDATISGSSEQVRRGDAIVMVGGQSEACEACADLFACFARQWFHVGPWGSGAKMKLVTNLVLGLNRAALAEGLAFARAYGLEIGRAHV